MAITDTIESIKTHVNNCYDSLNNKGATIPINKNINNLKDSIDSIPTGGGEVKLFDGHYDRDGLTAIGWSNDEIQYYQDNGVQWDSEYDDDFKLTDEEKSITSVDNTIRFLTKNISLPSTFNGYNQLLAIPLIDTSEKTSFQAMFYNCTSLTTIPLLDTSKCTNFSTAFYNCSSLMSIPLLDTSKCTSFSYMFYCDYSLRKISQIDTSKGTSFTYMFEKCASLKEIPELNLSSGTDFSYIFDGCYLLEKIPTLNTLNGTNFSSMFRDCYSLQKSPMLDTSKGINFSNMFTNCKTIRKISQIDTSKGTNFSNMFYGDFSLEQVPLLDMSNCISISGIFASCLALKTLGGFKDLGKAYLTTASANYSSYKLDLSNSKCLTKQSLLNVINNLYDIASIGVATQQLLLGSTNMAKLTEDEIAVAINKGWTVS